MPPLRVYKNKSEHSRTVWSVAIPMSQGGYNYHHFISPDGAFEFAKQWIKRFYKECVAYSCLQTIAVNRLSVEEHGLIQKLLRTRCKGITKAQYGWLRGIHERQEREW
jgi:hypothetical protein